MIVTLRDIKTGKEVTVTPDDICPCSHMRAEGNWSCDCNRETYFGNDTVGDICLGRHRYIVVAAYDFQPEEIPYDLLELNESYPRELVEKAVADHLETLVIKEARQDILHADDDD
jgi:hypothetical protein